MAGRPLKFKSVAALQKQIDAYFRSCWDYKRDMFGNRLIDKQDPKHSRTNPAYILVKVRPYTVTSLALALDTTRETLMDYEKGKYDDKDEDGKPVELTDEQKLYNEQVDTFSDTIKRAKLAIYADTEESLFTSKATGAIFSLKNNYKWVDRVEQAMTDPDGAPVTPTVRIIDERPRNTDTE
jgi:hypothetical protein